jgi:predicted Zn-dependent protease
VPVSFLEFQRTHELEADRFGLQLAARTGYEAAAFQRYVERTHSADSTMSPLPARELRLARLQETVSSLPSSMPSSSGEEFRRVQQTVRSIIERPEQHRVPTLRR